MILEQLDYLPVAGRRSDLLRRFEEHTHRLFLRHGFRPVGYFSTIVGKSLQEVTYLLAWTSLAEREACWAAFMADPEWQAARSDSEAAGPLVQDSTSRVLKAAPFSPMEWFPDPTPTV